MYLSDSNRPPNRDPKMRALKKKTRTQTPKPRRAKQNNTSTISLKLACGTPFAYRTGLIVCAVDFFFSFNRPTRREELERSKPFKERKDKTKSRMNLIETAICEGEPIYCVTLEMSLWISRNSVPNGDCASQNTSTQKEWIWVPNSDEFNMRITALAGCCWLY